MSRAATIRANVESALERKGTLSALTPQTKLAPPITPTGIGPVDEVLRGGLPSGVLTELIGTEGSGRTTMALACLAAVELAGSVAAWVDVSDVLDLESAAASGIDLERLLWVRCSTEQTAAASSPEATSTRAWEPAVSKPAAMPRHVGGGSPHPRTESRDMPKAVAAMLQAHGGLYEAQMRRERSRTVGTPGAPNRKLEAALANGAPQYRMEQVSTDRSPARRGENLALVPRCAEPVSRRRTEPRTTKSVKFDAPNRWTALDRALRVTDLLLQGGGFGAIVLDLGSTPAEFVWKIPLATWFRFRAACAQSRTSLILLTQHPCARSSAELVVRLQAGKMEADRTVMAGARFQAETMRDRAESARVVSIRKPPQSDRAGAWSAKAV